jgi:predicted transport protein
MALFKINNGNVKKLAAKDLDLEKHLQELFEANLEEILNITFLAHEYSTSSGGRIDTLGIDKNGSPCIIEYKRTQNENVINQGLSYLRWLLDHKAEFEKLVRSVLGKVFDSPIVTFDGEIKEGDFIDWSSPRVICIAESYNRFDLDTVDILPIKIELLRYRLYDDNILYLEPETHQKGRVSISAIVKNGKQEKSKDVELQKNYSVDTHIANTPKDTTELFQALRERIMTLDESIREEPMKFYIAYKLATNFVDVVVHKYGLKIFLNVKSGQLSDPKGLARDLENPKHIGHHGNGDYEVKLEKQEDTDAVFDLIKQSYDLNK